MMRNSGTTVLFLWQALLEIMGHLLKHAQIFVLFIVFVALNFSPNV